MLQRIAGRSDRRLHDLLGGSLLSMLLRVISVVTGFVLSVLIARCSNVEQAGLYFLGVTVLTVVGTLSRCGFDELVIKHAAPMLASDNWKSLNPLYTFIVVTVTVVAGCTAIVLYLLAPVIAENLFGKPEFLPVLRFAALSVPPFALCYLHAQFFQARKDVKRFQFYQNLGTNLLLIVVLASTLLIFGGVSWSAESLAALQLAALMFMMVLAVFSWLRLPPAHWHRGFAALWPLLKQALPVLAVVSLNMVMTWMVQLQLGVTASAAEVALYAVAFKTAMLTMILLAATNSVAGPRFAALYQRGDIEGLRYLAVWSTRLMLAICIPLALVMLAGAEQLMAVFGPQFVDAVTAFRILVLGQLLNVATGSVVLLLVLTGNARQALSATAIGVAVLLGLMLLLRPFGIEGAAMAQVSGLATQMLVATFFLHRRLGFTAMNIFARV